MLLTKTRIFNLYGAILASYNYRKNWNECDAKQISVNLFNCDGVSFYHADLSKAEQTIVHLKRLCKKGLRPSHRKFLRQIFVSVDITAPLNIWKHIDTYKIATTAQSTSSINNLGKEDFKQDNFENPIIDQHLAFLNWLKEQYQNSKTEDEKKHYFDMLDDNLPHSYLQMRTWTANYEVLRSIYEDRKNHKKKQWKVFCSWIESLLYFELLIKGE